ncbi:MAG: LysM peptidoglycan-binding domain-containing protein [Verrucomicrobiota bacterium]
MKPVLWIPASCALALALSSCGNSGGGSGNPSATTGPFDSRGNYVEEWADNPSKWRKSGGKPSPHELKSDDLPEIAKNDQPPQNSVPLASAGVSKPTKPAPVISQTQVVTSKPKPTVSKPQEVATKTTKRPVEKSDDDAVVKTKPKPKAKTVVAKAKPKPKPKSTRYVVKQGDSLSAIASRTGSSVSAIKSENGISGTLIRPGQSLVIPKR